MGLKIASRQSDLARIQALTVGQELQKLYPQLEITHSFRASLGDQNLNDPLWKMPQKGVFTEDFVEDLISGKQDMVVHSWKDLPTEQRPETEIYATLPREDVRDVLLFKRQSREAVERTGKLRCFSSSPRRIHNLGALLPRLLPFSCQQVEFSTVRGNVPTRLQKLLDGDVDALIVAKAALDRLLFAEWQEFSEMQELLRRQLRELQWMVLPVRENPPAAAQGALAIEIRSDRKDLKELLQALNCQQSWQQVQREREIFSSHGGGCHQKIGIIELLRPYGRIFSLRGETEDGHPLDEWSLSRDLDEGDSWPAAKEQQLFPVKEASSRFFEREPVEFDRQSLSRKDLWVARAEALPENTAVSADQLVWCSGTQSWGKLAQRGFWVNGCAEGLGEAESPRVEALLGRPANWIKLTHEQGLGENRLATYRLRLRDDIPDLSGYRFFYWMSGSQFLAAKKHYPEIVDGFHACGPGHSWQQIADELPAGKKPRVYLSYEHWRESLLSSSSD